MAIERTGKILQQEGKLGEDKAKATTQRDLAMIVDRPTVNVGVRLNPESNEDELLKKKETIDNYLFSENERTEFAQLFPSLDLEKALIVPWPELVRDVDKHPQAITQRQHNYWSNQKDLRSDFLRLLMDIKKGLVNSGDELGKRIVEVMHPHLLVGKDGKTLYTPESLRLFDAEDLNEEILDWVKREKVGRFNNVSNITDKRLQILFEKLKRLVFRSDISAQQAVEMVGDFYFHTIIDDPDANSSWLMETGSNSFFMNFVNGFLRLYGLNGISHGNLDLDNLDNFTGEKNEEGFKDYFKRRVLQANADRDVIDIRSPVAGGVNDDTIPKELDAIGRKFKVSDKTYSSFRQKGFSVHVSFLKAMAQSKGINPDSVPIDLPAEAVGFKSLSTVNENEKRFMQSKIFVM